MIARHRIITGIVGATQDKMRTRKFLHIEFIYVGMDPKTTKNSQL